MSQTRHRFALLATVVLLGSTGGALAADAGSGAASGATGGASFTTSGSAASPAGPSAASPSFTPAPRQHVPRRPERHRLDQLLHQFGSSTQQPAEFGHFRPDRRQWLPCGTAATGGATAGVTSNNPAPGTGSTLNPPATTGSGASTAVGYLRLLKSALRRPAAAFSAIRRPARGRVNISLTAPYEG